MEQTCENMNMMTEPQTAPAFESTMETGRPIFDSKSPVWDNRYIQDAHFQACLEKVIAWVAAYPPQTQILDFGCGSGVLLKALSAASFKLTGVDMSPRLLDEARRNLSTVPQNERAQLFEINAHLEGQHASQQYEGIFCLGVLEYLEEPQALLKHLTDLLKPGGFLMLSVPNQESRLRGVESWIHGHAGLFKPFGLFPSLTRPDNMLQFRQHHFTVKELSDELTGMELSLKRTYYHVAPESFKRSENKPNMGMNLITEWVKEFPDPYSQR
jgi:2-polyprenyl-3-methyl-5-hydroxy-6-metoxy-1,4-benzoquinol methylase